MHHTSAPREENLIYGLRPVIEALDAGKELDKVLVQKGIGGDIFHELRKKLEALNIPYQFVPPEKINRLVGNRNHQGVAAFTSAVTYQKIEDILPGIFEEGKTPLFVILDRVTDIRNFGAIARSAECAGAQAIIIPSRGAAPINGDALKTSAGALNKLPVCRTDNLKDTIEYLKESGLKIVACTEKTNDPYYKTDMSGPTAIIMGSEEDGISGEYLKRADAKVLIPMAGTIGSLNVSVAAGIILFEALKQRSS